MSDMEIYNEASRLEIKNKFYNSIDSYDREYLQEVELKLSNHVTEMGKVLKEAQDLYSNHDKNKGIFGEWLEIIGLNRTQANKLINRYEYVVNNFDNINLIESLPKSLSYEISKPSAIPELNQKVLDGEVKTLKEYKDLEIKFKIAQQENEFLKANPTVEIKEVVKEIEKKIEVVPDNVKRDLEQKSLTITNLTKAIQENENQVKRLQQDVRSLNNLKDKKEEIESKYRELDDLKIKLSKHRSEMQDMTKLFSFVDKFNQFLSAEMFPIVSILQIDNLTDKSKEDLRKINENLQNWLFAFTTKYKLN